MSDDQDRTENIPAEDRHVIELLGRHVGEAAGERIHLDLGAGSSGRAHAVATRLGSTYVAVNAPRSEPAGLSNQGIETHALDLSREDVLDGLEKIVNGRSLASVSIEGLERLADEAFLLRAVGRLVARHSAVAVVAVPNITHIEIATSLLLGRWTYPVGTADGVPFRPYSATSLTAALRRAGLVRVDSNDVTTPGTAGQDLEQVTLGEHSSFGAWLRAVRSDADPHALTSRFVWALAAVPARDEMSPSGVPAPFLSILMRSQGKRPQELREVLLCLAAQSNTDYEVILLGHRADPAGRAAIQSAVLDQPAAARARIRVHWIDRGSRAAPLNEGLGLARGRYVAVLDDDDVVFANWVEAFAEAANARPGRVVRSNTFVQDVENVVVLGHRGVAAVSAPKACYAKSFSLGEHLVHNQTPAHGYAYPRSLHYEFGLTYDETMTTTEDWQFLLRAAELCGVADVPYGTALYHWWSDRESSRTLHPREEWAQNQAAIERRVDSLPFLLPAGETRRLRGQLARLPLLERRVAKQEQVIARRDARIARLQANLSQHQTRLRRLERRQAKAAQRSGVGKVAKAEARNRITLRRIVKRLLRARPTR